MQKTSTISEYRPGDRVQYSSETRGEWCNAKVIHLHADDTISLRVTTPSGAVVERRAPRTAVRRMDQGPQAVSPPHTPESKVPAGSIFRVTTGGGTQYTVGQTIQYASESKGDWVPAEVVAIRPGGPDCELTVRRLDFAHAPVQQIPAHKVKHRPKAEILREIKAEQRRAADARREAERLRDEARRIEAEARRVEAEMRRLEASRVAYARQAEGYPYVALYTHRDRSPTHEIPRDGEPTAPLVHMCLPMPFHDLQTLVISCRQNLSFLVGPLLTPGCALQNGSAFWSDRVACGCECARGVAWRAG
jgi:hypothetical protein